MVVGTPAAPEDSRILTAHWVLPVSSPPIENGFVRIEGGKITALGRYAELPPSLKIAPPPPDTLITPGLVNTHLHLEQSFPQPIARSPEAPFVQWLVDVVAQIKRASSPEEKRARCLAGARELLRAGVTCVNDIASGTESLEVLGAGGFRGVVSLEVFHPAAEPVDITGWVRAYEAFRARRDPARGLWAGLSPHSPYNVSPQAWRALVAECRPFAVHTHVAEFPDEVQYLRGEPSCIPELHQRLLRRSFCPPHTASSPVRLLARWNLLGPRTILAHAIHTDIEDRALIAASGASIAHCPRSNLALHGKTLRMADWETTGAPIGLGTDGRLSTENLDLRAEARCAMALHGWTAERALKALTLDGARTLGLETELGSLKPGLLADMVLWKTEGADPPEVLALAESTRAVTVMTGGVTRWSEERGFRES